MRKLSGARAFSYLIIALSTLSPIQIFAQSVIYPPIVLSEIIGKPSDNNQEFIEIKNLFDYPVFLEGWQIIDQSEKAYTFGKVVIDPGQYLAIGKDTSKLSLNNDQETISLVDPAGTLVDQTSYQDAQTDASWGWSETGWQWLESPTPSQPNALPVMIPTDQNKSDQQGSVGQSTPSASDNQSSKSNDDQSIGLYQYSPEDSEETSSQPNPSNLNSTSQPFSQPLNYSQDTLPSQPPQDIPQSATKKSSSSNKSSSSYLIFGLIGAIVGYIFYEYRDEIRKLFSKPKTDAGFGSGFGSINPQPDREIPKINLVGSRNWPSD